jgi:hypothetical protein
VDGRRVVPSILERQALLLGLGFDVAGIALWWRLFGAGRHANGNQSRENGSDCMSTLTYKPQ